MPAIGYVTKEASGGGYKCELKTLSIRAEIEIVPNTAMDAGSNQPDVRVLTLGLPSRRRLAPDRRDLRQGVRLAEPRCARIRAAQAVCEPWPRRRPG
jgi:uncharacterized protein (DUF736 family)